MESCSSCSPYRYESLQNALEEIRLVHLLPGAFDDQIKIRIIHSPLPLIPATPPESKTSLSEHLRPLVSYPWTIQETEGGTLLFFNVVTGETSLLSAEAAPPEKTSDYEPRYEALSYTWGDGEASELLQVELESSKEPGRKYSTLKARPNLASALRYLRHVDDIRIIWIDAICINQEDIEERNEQVKRMTNIYALAHQVVAWLGEESGDSGHAFATLQHVGRQLEATKSGRVIAAPDAAEPHLWRNDQPPSFDGESWDALINFVERPWFYRLWCWQEIRLGGRQATLQCGSDIIQWDRFWLALLCLHNKDRLPSMEFRERCRHIVFLKDNEGWHSMSNLLDVNRSKGCANPRDKIYGLLGITPARFRSRITVDYARPIEEVYKEAFLAHLQITQRLELLKHCRLANRHIGGPSWVPDWSHTEFAAPILSEQLSSGISQAWYTHVEPDTLEVIGKQHTKIKFVGAVASKVEKETLLVVKDWFQCLPSKGTYLTGESMENAFAVTLCMNRTRERHPFHHFLSIIEWVNLLRKFLRLNADSDDDPVYFARETSNTVQKIRGRCFFLSEDGHMGTAPAGTQIGDSICLLLGTYAPVVLRQTSTGSFQVVGECYVQGLEDAAGLLGPLPRPWKAIIKGDSLGRPIRRFINLWTSEETLDDPRLEPLPSNWERAAYERSEDDAAIFERFRNLDTGDLVDHDPRLSPSALEARGVELQTFKLV